jgi:hypothetical protein
MIDYIFYFGNEVILIKVDGANVTFGNTSYGAMMAPIEGLKLDKQGVIKEYPDLAYAEDWREEAIKRFKFKIKEMATEKEIGEYIINDLKRYGYIPYMKHIKGFRPISLREQGK